MNIEATSDVGEYAGFWRRIFAFVIDILLLGLFGMVIGTTCFDAMMALGAWGRLLGFVIAMLYFAPLNSRISNGQTLGKRWMKIRVVGPDGAPLPLSRSLLRYLVLGLPWFLNNAQFPMSWLESPFAYVLAIVVFGLSLAIIYLFVANRPSRRSLHDLLVGSSVVQAGAEVPVVNVPLARVHGVVAGLLIAASATLPLVANYWAKQEYFVELEAAQQAASQEPGVYDVGIMKGWSSWNGKRSTYVQVTARLHSSNIEDRQLAQRLAKRVIIAAPTSRTVDVVIVTFIYGFDIGITSFQHSQTYNDTAVAWLGEAKT